jgi:hypothetical protein
MCGIFGNAGRHQALPLFIDGLRRSEYRWHDSASAGRPVCDSSCTMVRSCAAVRGIIPGISPSRSRWVAHRSSCRQPVVN